MIRIAKFFLFLFLLLFAIFYLVVTKIQPDTQKIVLGVAAALAAIALIVDMFGWKRAASIMLLAVPLGATGCMGVGTITNAAKELKNQTIIINANTPWGPQRYIGLNTNTTVIVSPDGTLTINPLPAQPDNESENLTVVPVTELRVNKSGTKK